MANQSPETNQSAFSNVIAEGSDDQELGASYFRQKMSTSFCLLKVTRKLLRMEERLLLYFNNTDMPFLESIVGQGLGSQIKWVTLKVRMISTMLKVAAERINSGSASNKEIMVLERFAISVSEIIRLIDGDIINNLMPDEVLGYSSPTELCKHATQFRGKILPIEAQINGLHDLHDWAATLGLTSGEHSRTMSATNSRIIGQAVAEEERTDVLTVGLEEDVQIITSKLIGGQTRREIVAIVGPKGIGKTTLARKLYHNPEVAHHFRSRAWVTLPPLDFEPNSVLVSIAKQILVGYAENESMEKIRDKLCRLWWYGRYLIVLDDAHVIEDASKTLCELFPNASNGSRLLITTTKRDLVKASPSCYIHERRPLGDEEAWELFNATLGFQVDAQVEQLARDIVKKCSGCPSFILKVRDFMSKKAEIQDQWFLTLSQINDAHTSHYLALGSNFEHLPSNAKQCLLCFILFRQNEIPARRLIVLWVAEGLVGQTKDSAETAESAADKILIELVQRCMIQVAKWKPNGKVKTCRLNCHLMDNFFSEAEKDSFLTNSQEAASKSSNRKPRILRVADHLDNGSSIFSHIHDNDSIGSSSFKHRYGRLVSFLSFDYREGPLPGQDIGNFIHRGITLRCLNMVRVIDLEGTFRPKLPDSIKKLTQLRYLGLRRTYTELLPSSIGKLLNLQTLDLKHTCLRSLPGSIWKLQQLRHLYLSEMYRSRIVAPESSGSLLDIQTLWGAFVDEETRIEDGLNRLTNLRKLGLVYNLTLLQQGLLAEWISKLHHLESLRLRSIDDMNQPTLLYLKTIPRLLNKLSSLYLIGRLANPFILEALPESLTEITLSFSGLVVDPLRALEKLPCLRILNLRTASYTNKSMVCSSGGFPLLRVLNLWMLEDLEEWIVKDGSLTILRHLEIRSCKNLKMIPEGLKHLANCRELKLTDMPDEIKARVTKDQGLDWYKIVHIPSVIVNN